MLGPLLAMPSGQGLNMTLLAILKVNRANWLLVLEKNWSCGKMFLLLTRYHDWSDNIIYNYTIIYLDCTSIISHFKSMRIPEVPYVFRKICVSQFKLGFLYFSWLFSTKQTWRRFGSLTRKPSSKIGRSLGDRPIIQIPGFAEWTFFCVSSVVHHFLIGSCWFHVHQREMWNLH